MRMVGSLGSRVMLAGCVAVTALAPLARAGEEAGKAVFEKSCKACHSIAGEGGKMANVGGPLDGVGAKRDADWLRKYILDPKAEKPDSKMPKAKLTDQELADVVAYLATLKAPAAK
ncbi:MAG TPA: c-type cytochrome [Candidatus Binatia bacterium]|nr:c-type cytochrome [Candidatus Binatia bacterium]